MSSKCLYEKNDLEMSVDPFIVLCTDSFIIAPEQYHKYTVCALAIRCFQHDTMAVCSLQSSIQRPTWWLPYVAVRECFKWSEMGSLIGQLFCNEYKIPFDKNKLLFKCNNPNNVPFEQIFPHCLTRIQMPNGEFIQQIIYTARWNTSYSCCQNTSNIRWISLNKFNSNYDIKDDKDNVALNNLLGSEVISYAQILSINPKPDTFEVIEQSGAGSVFKYLEPSDIKSNTKSHQLITEFISAVSIGKNETLRIYNDFIQHIYPSVNMSWTSFEKFALKIGLQSSIKAYPLKNIFRAMNYKIKKYISFNEFLLGLVALDRNAPNTKLRLSFLFRYYDSDSDGYLSNDDLQSLICDINKQMNQVNQIPSISNKINFDKFFELINMGKIVGIESICRSTKSIKQIINESPFSMIGDVQLPFTPRIANTCKKCSSKNYSIALHSLILGKNGRVTEPHLIINGGKIFDESKQTFQQKHSIEYVFNSTSNANYILNLIRKLAGFNQMSDQLRQETITNVSNGLSLNVIRVVCDDVFEIFSNESRVLKISTPTYVLGDIHGNINDLLIFESQLWPMAPSALAPNVLFLGDYVDRGQFSIEVALYLFAMKILAPNKFFLLRGNHEVRHIQKSFTFEKECFEKYGTYGGNVFDMFNRIFDILPFAAIVDESIYCVHGGIPFTQTKIEDLCRIPLVLQDPEQEAPAVWEILWSDPMTNIEFQELSHFMKKNINDDMGYLSNMKRSTAFYFAEKATQNFLKQNNLTHVIRAHEVINEGFKFNHRGKVITIFSCSRYCGGPNKAAAIMIETIESQGFIKIISLET